MFTNNVTVIKVGIFSNSKKTKETDKQMSGKINLSFRLINRHKSVNVMTKNQ